MRPMNKPHLNPRLQSVVLDIRARHGAQRILGIGRGAQSLCHHLRAAGYSVGFVEPDNSLAAYAAETAAVNEYCSSLIDPSPIPGMPFEMAIRIETDQWFSEPSSVVEIAAAKLKEGGILVMSMPYSGYLKTMMATLQGGWKSAFSWARDSHGIKHWSRRRLIVLLESRGFKVIEYIGVRNSSLQWETLILVVRKAG